MKDFLKYAAMRLGIVLLAVVITFVLVGAPIAFVSFLLSLDRF